MPFPTAYTPELWERILERVSDGESLRKISSEEKVSMSAIMRWIADDPVKQGEYVNAKDAMAHAMAEDMLVIADDSSNDTISTEKGDFPNREWIERSKLRVDTRKWLMSKLLPKKYGDKTAIEHSGNLPVPMTLAELDARIEQGKK